MPGSQSTLSRWTSLSRSGGESEELVAPPLHGSSGDALCFCQHHREHAWPRAAGAGRELPSQPHRSPGSAQDPVSSVLHIGSPGHRVSVRVTSCPIQPPPPPLLFGPLGILTEPIIFNRFASDNVILRDIAVINRSHTSLNSVSKFLCIFDRPIYPCCSSSPCSQWHSTGGEFCLLFTVCAFKQ